MKAIFKLKSLAALLLGLVTMCMTSCDEEDDENTVLPADVRDMAGSYVGSMRIDGTEDQSVTVHVGNKLSIFAFPMKMVLDSVFQIDEKSDLAKQLATTVYSVGYNVTVGTDTVALDILPRVTSMKITIDKKEHVVRMAISPVKRGVYDKREKTLTFSLRISDVRVDGVKAEKFKTIELEINKAKKE